MVEHFIGIDPAHGPDKCVVSMGVKEENGNLRMIWVDECADFDKNIVKKVLLAYMKSALPKSKHRSDRLTKKLFRRSKQRFINVTIAA